MQLIMWLLSLRSTKGCNEILCPVRKQLSVVKVHWPSNYSVHLSLWMPWQVLLAVTAHTLWMGMDFPGMDQPSSPSLSISEGKMAFFLQSWCVPRTSIRGINHLAARWFQDVIFFILSSRAALTASLRNALSWIQFGQDSSKFGVNSTPLLLEESPTALL